MKYLITVLTLWVSTIAYGQDTVQHFIRFLSENKCEPHEGYYYRMAYRDGEWWRVEDYYYKERSLYRSAIYKYKNANDSFYTPMGMILTYHPNKKVKSKEVYVDGLKEGLARSYDTAGRLIDSARFKKDMPIGYWYKWNSKGDVVFKGIYDDEGSGKGINWMYHDNGKLSAYGITSKGATPDSIWTFYYDNGNISSVETYDKDSLLNIQCFDEDGRLSKDSCMAEKMPVAPYSVNAFLGKNIKYPSAARYNNISGRVSVMFTVDESGKITDIQSIGRKLGAGCDEEAVRVVSLLPPWKPGRYHNRRIKVLYTLPITFRLE